MIPNLASLILGTLVDPTEVRLIDGLPRSLHDVLGRDRPIACLTGVGSPAAAGHHDSPGGSSFRCLKHHR